jgi:glycosyltransferase involved in cell wall biosynthesis
MTTSLPDYYRKISLDLDQAVPVAGKESAADAPLAVARNEVEIDELGKELKWAHERIAELEDTPRIFRVRDTEGLRGWRLRAAEFSNTVSDFVWRGRSRERPDLQRSVKMREHELFDLKQSRLAEFTRGKSVDLDSRRRILIDVTYSLSVSFLTGFQRVSWEFCNSAIEYGAIPVFLHKDAVFAYDSTLSRVVPIEMREQETFFWIDASWNYHSAVAQVMRCVDDLGGSNIFMIHDLFPVTLSHFTSKETTRLFRAWMNSCVLNAGAVVCISETVANELMQYASRYHHRIDHIGWSHHGCNVPTAGNTSVSDRVKDFVATNKNFFLSVSSIEPRKCYLTAIDAFDHLWEQGLDVGYVIVGRYGWMAESVRRRIEIHPLFGTHLLWLQSASDADLLFLYEKARGLVSPSIAEGFGLPLVEAASKGLPVIASDIPIFRELGGDKFTYFDLCDSEALEACIVRSLVEKKEAPDIAFKSWKESARNTIGMIRAGSYQFAYDPGSRTWTQIADSARKKSTLDSRL